MPRRADRKPPMSAWATQPCPRRDPDGPPWQPPWNRRVLRHRRAAKQRAPGRCLSPWRCAGKCDQAGCRPQGLKNRGPVCPKLTAAAALSAIAADDREEIVEIDWLGDGRHGTEGAASLLGVGGAGHDSHRYGGDDRMSELGAAGFGAAQSR